jgi:hypothetical protein
MDVSGPVLRFKCPILGCKHKGYARSEGVIKHLHAEHPAELAREYAKKFVVSQGTQGSSV